MIFIGSKKKKFYERELSRFLPGNIKVYVEPFGGSFAVSRFINKPVVSVYNDINTYDIDIDADFVHHVDYSEVFDLYDGVNTVFFIDPPYYKKEYLYDNCEHYNEKFHVELRDRIDKLAGKVVITYNNERFIRMLYSKYDVHQCAGVFSNELIITKL